MLHKEHGNWLMMVAPRTWKLGDGWWEQQAEIATGVAAEESGEEEEEEEILVCGDGDAGAVGFFVIMGGAFFIKVAVSLQWGIWRDTVCFCVCW